MRVAETETASLVGQFLPNDAPPLPGAAQDRIVWRDGVVTQAFCGGDWALLDNLSEAEAAVLERLNPLLESPAMWTLTERGTRCCSHALLSTTHMVVYLVNERGIQSLHCHAATLLIQHPV